MHFFPYRSKVPYFLKTLELSVLKEKKNHVIQHSYKRNIFNLLETLQTFNEKYLAYKNKKLNYTDCVRIKIVPLIFSKSGKLFR